MEDLEFKKCRQMIEDQKVVADTCKNSFNTSLEPLNKAISTIVESIDKRNILLRDYVDDVYSFESSNNLTKPSDIFLGVRTAVELVKLKYLCVPSFAALVNYIEESCPSVRSSFKSMTDRESCIFELRELRRELA